MIRVFLLAVALLFPQAVMAEVYLIDKDASTIEYEGTHDGKTFTGEFKEWRANVLFDPEQPESSSIFVQIDTSSGDSGNGFYDGTIKNKDWFNVKKYPYAQFTSKDIVKNEDGSYTANGSLKIKDITKPITFDFTLSQPTATNVQAVAEFIIPRLDYAIGAESDADGKWVSKDITLRFDLMTTPNSLSLIQKK
jgi:polyisoprenoid-binding protein YceI